MPPCVNCPQNRACDFELAWHAASHVPPCELTVWVLPLLPPPLPGCVTEMPTSLPWRSPGVTTIGGGTAFDVAPSPPTTAAKPTPSAANTAARMSLRTRPMADHPHFTSRRYSICLTRHMPSEPRTRVARRLLWATPTVRFCPVFATMDP